MDVFMPQTNTEADRESDGFIRGLVVAIVTDNVDPDGLARIRVRLPWQLENQESYWARLAMPMAMSERGVFFLPEVGDEVLVGFEKGDPTHPCIIGSLWNGKSKPPENNADKNNDWRLIKTRANSELRFFDGQPPSLELKLEDGKRLFMDDQGITVEDGKGNLVKIESNSGAVSVVANGELKLKGQRVAIESASTMDIKATGTMTIKGALVQIN